MKREIAVDFDHALGARPAGLALSRSRARNDGRDAGRGEDGAAARAHRAVGAEHDDFAHLRGGRRHD